MVKTGDILSGLYQAANIIAFILLVIALYTAVVQNNLILSLTAFLCAFIQAANLGLSVPEIVEWMESGTY